jgi:hypothetical protein
VGAWKDVQFFQFSDALLLHLLPPTSHLLQSLSLFADFLFDCLQGLLLRAHQPPVEDLLHFLPFFLLPAEPAQNLSLPGQSFPHVLLPASLRYAHFFPLLLNFLHFSRIKLLSHLLVLLLVLLLEESLRSEIHQQLSHVLSAFFKRVVDLLLYLQHLAPLVHLFLLLLLVPLRSLFHPRVSHRTLSFFDS